MNNILITIYIIVVFILHIYDKIDIVNIMYMIGVALIAIILEGHKDDS